MDKQNKDIFIKEELEYLVQLPIKSQVLKVLKECFKVREIIIIEPKDEEETIKRGV